MKILISNKVYKQLNKLPESVRRKCVFKIRELDGMAASLLDIRKLTNRDGFRLRVGDYRIVYEVDHQKKEINILSVAHRKEVYRISG